jgi:SAM-dependent methyltransferase
MTIERSCAVCGSNNKQLLFRQQFSGFNEGNLLDGYDVVACQQCGFCFADHIPDQAAFDQYYRNMSKYERHEHSGHMNEYDQHRLPITAQLITRHVPNRQARVLDVGCSTGSLLYVLTQYGFDNVLGLDPSPVCAQVAQDLYKIRVVTGALADLSSSSETFGLIILSSVLEHIRDLDTALAKLYDLLAEQGKLYLEVPDVTAFATSPDAPFQEFSIEHINYFSIATLSNLLQKHNFQFVFAQQDSVEPSPGHIAHEIKALYQKREASAAPITRDATAEKGLADYIDQSRRVEQHIHETIDHWAISGQPIIVWGVGTHTQRLLATSKLSQANIVAFVDSNPRYQGKELNGIRILAPADLKSWSEPILISSMVFQKDIEQQIRKNLQLTNEVVKLYQN